MQGVQSKMAHPGALRHVFLRERDPVDPVLDHSGSGHEILRCFRPDRELDLDDLHGVVHSLHFSR